MINLSTMSPLPIRSPSEDRGTDFQIDSTWAGATFRQDASTGFIEGQKSSDTSTTPRNRRVVPPSPQRTFDRAADIDATVIQLWEGRVLEVDWHTELMQVSLTSKIGTMPEHTAEIELQWVSDQDRDLVVAGAVFYLTLYKQTRRGSIKNSQELRFRRRPAWTKQQVRNIYADAALILSKMQSQASEI